MMTEAAPRAVTPSPEAPDIADKASSWRARARRWATIGLGIFLFAPYYMTCAYIVVDPPVSTLMLRKAFGNGIDYEWRDLDSISPLLVTQVIASEDGRFCEHWGVDWSAIDRAFDAVADGRPKGGGSTLSMQTVKNLFLWNRPAVLRKPFEIPLAYYADFVWGKRRLMEIYLNIVEWAPGIYGAEAAAQHHFHKSAAALTPQEAAQLAAALPNPKRRNAGRPGPRVFALASRLRARAARERDDAFCVLDTKEESGLAISRDRSLLRRR